MGQVAKSAASWSCHLHGAKSLPLPCMHWRADHPSVLRQCENRALLFLSSLALPKIDHPSREADSGVGTTPGIAPPSRTTLPPTRAAPKSSSDGELLSDAHGRRSALNNPLGAHRTADTTADLPKHLAFAKLRQLLSTAQLPIRRSTYSPAACSDVSHPPLATTPRPSQLLSWAPMSSIAGQSPREQCTA